MDGEDALRSTIRRRLTLAAGVLAAGALVLSACGGGGVTAGVGGSGIGGTGVTLVRGNVSTVIASAAPLYRRGTAPTMLAGFRTLIGLRDAVAAGEVSGIQVSGGGQSAVTDAMGRFALVGVTPSADFILTLQLPEGTEISFSIGPVPAGAEVQVNNIVVNPSEGTATPASIEVQESANAADDDGGSGDGGSDDGGSDDGDGEDPDDDVSADEEDDGANEDHGSSAS